MRLLLAVAIVTATPITAYAASYGALKSQGYKTSGLTGRGLSRGWVVSKGGTRYFCKQRRSKQAWKNILARSQGQPKASQVGSCRKLR